MGCKNLEMDIFEDMSMNCEYAGKTIDYDEHVAELFGILLNATNKLMDNQVEMGDF